MSFTRFFGKWNHHQALFGCRQLMPHIGVIFEHYFVVLIVDNHSKNPHVVDA